MACPVPLKQSLAEPCAMYPSNFEEACVDDCTKYLDLFDRI